MNLYAAIGEDFIHRALREFYHRAFIDPIIGYFFFNKNNEEKEHLIRMQISFACSMLGASKPRYEGRSLASVHKGLGIRIVHFRRRQILFAEVLEDLGLEPSLRNQWLALEGRLQSQIVNNSISC